jgi:hypothetical protein
MGLSGDDVALLHQELAQLGYEIGRTEERQQEFGATTRTAVAGFQRKQGLPTNGIVDEPSATALTQALQALGLGQHQVRGQVRQLGGQQLAGAVVKLFHVQLRREEELGSGSTDRTGRYAITYMPPADRARGRAFNIRVVAQSNDGAALAESPVVFDAQPDEVVDLEQADDGGSVRSEYDRLQDELADTLGDIAVEDLSPDERELVARSSGAPEQRIETLANARRLGRAWGVSAEVAFALLQDGVSADQRGLLTRRLPDLRQLLITATERDVISAPDLDRAMDALEEATVKLAFQSPDPGNVAALADVLAVALPDRQAQAQFLRRYARHEADAEVFWDDLATDLGDSTVQRVQRTLQLDALARSHLPLVQRLDALLEAGALRSLRDLATWEEADWLGLLREGQTGEAIGTPAGVPGKTKAQREKAYAGYLKRSVQRAFPTAAVQHRLETDEEFTNQAYTRFLQRNGEFEFGRQSALAFLREHPGALADVEPTERATLTRQLLGMERLFGLARTPQQVHTLMRAGLDSANSLLRLGKWRLTHVLGSEPEAVLMMAQAKSTAITSLAVTAKYAPAYNQITAHVLPPPWLSLLDDLDTSANLSNLFGSQNFCTCKHCRSFYSPAAYLVDLLEFLDRFPSDQKHQPGDAPFSTQKTNFFLQEKVVDLAGQTPELSARDVLLLRRPDIAQLELSCANTNTLVPYVDLVNEVLEHRVAQEGFPNRIAVDGAAEELAAHPQPLNPSAQEAAYAILARQRYPWSLPFNLWARESDVYLEHLGTPRHQIMSVLRRNADAPAEDLAIADAYLGLTTEQRSAIFSQQQPWVAWGLGATVSGKSWSLVLRSVSQFLDRARLSFEELQDLLAMRFINPLGQLKIEAAEGQNPNTCDVEQLVIDGLGPADWAATLMRAHGFLRLQRVLGWKMAELDQALTAFQVDTLTEDVLLIVTHVERLRKRLRAPIATVLSWWAPLGTRSSADGPSLYERLFQNKAVRNPVDQAFRLSLVTKPDSDERLLDHAETILAALQLQADDLALLTDPVVAQQHNLVSTLSLDARLTLDNLSLLHRIASFARSLRLSVRDFLIIRSLLGLDPFDPGDLSQAGRFVDLVEKLRAALISAADLDHLLRHSAPSTTKITPDDNTMATILGAIATERDRLFAETTPVKDDVHAQQAQLRAWLGQLSLADTPEEADSVPVDQVLVDQVLQVILEVPGQGSAMSLEDAQAIVQGTPSVFPDPDAFGLLKTPFDRMSHVADHLRRRLYTQLSTAATLQILGEAAGLDSDSTAILLQQLLTAMSPGSATVAALHVFLQEDKDGATQRRVLIRFFKCAWMIDRLEITGAELIPLLNQVGFDLNTLPADSADANADAGSLIALVDLVGLRKNLRPGALLNILAAHASAARDTPADFVNVLGAETGWPIDDLNSLVGPAGWFAPSFADLSLDRKLLRLVPCFAILKRLGLSAQAALLLAQPDETLEAAQKGAAAVKHAAKAKYDEEGWLGVAKPLRDRLRDHQRNALVDYLLWRDDRRDTSDLYADLLLDVEMDPCMMTSRIKLAISSVQLFVQRSFLRLEESVKLDDEARAEWEWMKVYRIWEANRKVFLYPENWIEPELRDDKSPFFKELESELMQGDLDDRLAETAVRKYLDKLNEVSRLEIVGMTREVESGGVPREVKLHVFARTHAEPHTYFYRCQVERNRWTPWEKIPLDIQSDHLIPVVHNGRLYLFWAIINEVGSDFQVGDDEVEPELDTQLEIRLAWSEYRHGQWSAQKQQRVGPLHVWNYQQDADPWKSINDYRDKITFRVDSANNSRIRIDCYVTDDWKQQIRLLGEYYFQSDIQQISTGRVAEPELKIGHDVFHPTSSAPTAGNFGSSKAYTRRMGFMEKPPSFTTQSHPVHSVVLANGGMPYTSDTLPEILVLGSSSDSATYHLLFPPLDDLNHAFSPFFFSEGQRVFFVRPKYSFLDPSSELAYHFAIFYNPYIRRFLKALHTQGLDGLLGGLEIQRERDAFFEEIYAPEDYVSYPEETVDFSPEGAYSLYNWELFFHIPLLIAERLSQNQRFEEAQKWYHYVFNPTTGSSDLDFRRFWKVRPLYENVELDTIEEVLRQGGQELASEVQQWRHNPFMPHLLARQRLVAYQKNVVMKYIDNLIAWADHLFRRDTIESINEATQLYLLAADILGQRPVALPTRGEAADRTYQELAPALDELSNALMPVENLVLALMPAQVAGPVQSLGGVQASRNKLAAGKFALESSHLHDRFRQIVPQSSGAGNGLWLESDIDGTAGQVSNRPAGVDHLLAVANSLVFYFCIPANDKLLAYWDLVADRLFKIRHCMNIEGIERQLRLFEPPIDPALLVKAKAAGLSLSSVLDDLYSPAPHHRFTVLAQKATELVGELKQLGNAVLVAMEKRDVETLSLLRSTHEVNLLKATREIKRQQIQEATETLASLNRAKKTSEHRFKHYAAIDRFSAGEIASMIMSGEATVVEAASEAIVLSAASTHPTPDESRGDIAAGQTSGTFGNRQVHKATGIANAGEAIGRAVGIVAKLIREAASIVATIAGYERRWDDWKLQEKLAELEMRQIDRQIAAAEIRVQILEHELENHDLQTENAQEVADFMRQKFTNQELYGWMVGQISTVYFQTYKLAHDLAKRAERAYRHELGVDDSSFIQFGYWDSLKKGLLAGERLALDLKRMEVAFLEQNRREFEITRHVSLLQLDPMALIELRATGQCTVQLPEALFDMDGPGHYFRRIKTVAVSIPCVAGPYASVNCTLALLKSSVRKSSLLGDVYVRTGAEDSRFSDSYGNIQSIVTSSAQNDSGLFETNLRDERFLPFEGAGVISEWRLELPADPSKRQPQTFDYNTISDVILHIRYTARQGGGLLRTGALEALQTLIDEAAAAGSVRLFSLRHEFPMAWAAFKTAAATDSNALPLKINLTPQHYPFWSQTKSGATREVKKAELIARAAGDVSVTLPGGANQDLPKAKIGDLKHTTISEPSSLPPFTGEWQIELSGEGVEDVWLLVQWGAEQ